MMDHLSPAEFVDAAEGTLASARASHAESCASCRERLDAVRGAMQAAGAVDAPEPSPLYWPHLAARVRERLNEETIAPAWRAGWRDGLAARALVPMASALALVAAVFVAGQVSGRRAADAPVATPAAVAMAPPEMPVDADETEAWQVLTSAAAEVPIEEAHAAGMAVPAGAVDRAVQHLTPAELDALRQLLQSELHRAGD
jgi:hypothetical protein